MVLISGIVVACGRVTPSETPSMRSGAPESARPAAAQRLVCGRVERTQCARIVAAVVSMEPDMATSPVAVVAQGDAVVQTAYASRSPFLVAFQPDSTDYWMKPPTWVYTEQDGGNVFFVEEWQLGALPADFGSLLKAAGIAP